jgi:hypothetical protein
MKFTFKLMLVALFGLLPVSVLAESNSGFGFGMGSATPERSGNRYGWGFGSTDDDPGDGIEQSSMNGGMGWQDGRRSYPNRWSGNRSGSRSGFSFGSSRNRYAPSTWTGHPGYGAYPPVYDPRWAQPMPAYPRYQQLPPQPE